MNWIWIYSSRDWAFWIEFLKNKEVCEIFLLLFLNCLEHETLIYFSRAPTQEIKFASVPFRDSSLDFINELIVNEAGTWRYYDYFSLIYTLGNLLQIMEKFVAKLKSHYGWINISFSDVVCTNHLNLDGTVNYAEVLTTLKRLFRYVFTFFII
jgi:hypothetical protein